MFTLFRCWDARTNKETQVLEGYLDNYYSVHAAFTISFITDSLHKDLYIEVYNVDILKISAILILLLLVNKTNCGVS